MTDTTQMGPGNPEEREARIAEYVLGTLAGAEREAFEAELARDAALQRAVADWSDRMQPLADSVPAEAPPVALRRRVFDQIAARAPAEAKPFSLARWLAWTFGLSALAGAAAVALVLVFTPRPPVLAGYAMLHDDKGSDSVVAFQVDRDRHDMFVYASTPAAGAGHDYELWVLPQGKNPISLGVFKAGERQQRPLTATTAAFIEDGTELAVSLEPAGGAPGGQPTGPILFTGFFHPPVQPSAP
ncbi:MAG TPA: anti-sigma factor [Candidatus Binatia bacterium]|nr:anti-sigma factor [Candidatus Binatia bacterium]